MGNRKKMIGACENSVPESLFAGTLADPHSVLGIHDWNDGKIVRVYDPLACTVEILTGTDFSKSLPMKDEGRGLFTAFFKRKKFFPYRLKKTFSDGSGFESADPYSPKVIRSSGGSIFNLKIAETTEKEFLFHVKHTGFAVFSADMDGENLYGIKNFPENMFLIVGNEGQGVSSTIMESSTNSISIPMSKHLESLNAGVSGSIIMSYIASKK